MRIPLEIYNEILKLAMNDESPSLEVGEIFYFELYERFPKLAEEIVGTDRDMFDKDENLYNFYKQNVIKK